MNNSSFFELYKETLPFSIESVKPAVYPNPASDFIELSINNETNPNASFAQIFNIFGIEVSKSSLTDGNNRINISHLPAGVYYIRIGDKTEKFVKI
ncbi:MAG: T9SS type A sorting domain-containing protein [Candidatus Kapabacteria bacterium]|jgi:hypothetical protein|nr:T9SS type A sorting domain-containing protein [Candidatus Kapabacteria bacterium]